MVNYLLVYVDGSVDVTNKITAAHRSDIDAGALDIFRTAGDEGEFQYLKVDLLDPERDCWIPVPRVGSEEDQ